MRKWRGTERSNFRDCDAADRPQHGAPESSAVCNEKALQSEKTQNRTKYFNVRSDCVIQIWIGETGNNWNNVWMMQSGCWKKKKKNVDCLIIFQHCWRIIEFRNLMSHKSGQQITCIRCFLSFCRFPLCSVFAAFFFFPNAKHVLSNWWGCFFLFACVCFGHLHVATVSQMSQVNPQSGSAL